MPNSLSPLHSTFPPLPCSIKVTFLHLALLAVHSQARHGAAAHLEHPVAERMVSREWSTNYGFLGGFFPQVLNSLCGLARI